MTMTRAARHTLIVLAAALLACDANDPENNLPSTPTLVNSQQSACKVNAAGELADLDLTVQGSDLFISHRNASYNCAAKVAMEGTISGNTISIKEVITNPNDTMMRCVCDYDLSAQVKGLAAGTYLVELTDAEGQLVSSSSVTIEGASKLDAVNAAQSACKATPVGEYPAEGLKTGLGSGQLTVTHENAHYNCAAKVTMEASLQGTEIIVRETISNPGEAAFCMCDFDLSVQLTGLPAGSFTLKLFDADGQLVSTEQVTI